MDVTIFDVPEEAVDEVKRMAAVAIERYHRKSVVVTKEVEDTFKAAVDDFRIANSLTAKYSDPAEVAKGL